MTVCGNSPNTSDKCFTAATITATNTGPPLELCSVRDLTRGSQAGAGGEKSLVSALTDLRLGGRSRHSWKVGTAIAQKEPRFERAGRTTMNETRESGERGWGWGEASADSLREPGCTDAPGRQGCPRSSLCCCIPFLLCFSSQGSIQRGLLRCCLPSSVWKSSVAT